MRSWSRLPHDGPVGRWYSEIPLMALAAATTKCGTSPFDPGDADACEADCLHLPIVRPCSVRYLSALSTFRKIASSDS
jgi:hypothetical protein